MEFNDGIGCRNSQNCSTSGLTEIENDGQESCGTKSTSTTSLVSHVERRGVKRGNGMVVDSGATTSVVPEQMFRTRGIHEKFALLRATVPNLCTDERSSILTGAYEYIERLQRQEAELRCELGVESSCDDEELSCCEDEVSCSSCREAEENSGAVDFSAAGCSEFESLSYGSYCGCSSQPMSVEVVRTVEGSLRIHIECRMRPRLLLEIMELLESSGLTVEEANVECVERLLFDGIGLEDVEGISDGGESSNITRVSAEFVGASLRSLIGDRTQGNTV